MEWFIADAPAGSVSSSVSGVVLTAAIAALGYLSKQFIDLIRAILHERKLHRAQLIELRSLLRATRATYRTQRDLSDRLLDLLEAGRPGELLEGGCERVFSRLHKEFTPDEKELHSIIRGITEHSMAPLNAALVSWLRRDTYYQAATSRAGLYAELAKSLGTLDAHLAVWNGKFQAWIPQQPAHALVYLEDEESHGVGFPSEIDGIVERLINGESCQPYESTGSSNPSP